MKTTLNIHAADSEAVEVATVSNKALTTNVATLTTAAVHGLTTGDRVVVAGVGSPFDGTYAVASTPSTTTFTYAKTNANVVSVAATGTVSRVPIFSSLAFNGRRGREVVLQNRGTGVVSYDFTEPAEGADLAATGVSLAVNASVTLKVDGTLYVSTTIDNTDLRYITFG